MMETENIKVDVSLDLLVDTDRAVKEVVNGANDAIVQGLVNRLAEKEIERRGNALEKAYTELKQLNADFIKIKPDVVSYYGDGTVASQAYSKAALDNRKQQIDKINKLSANIRAALEKNEWNKLLS